MNTVQLTPTFDPAPLHADYLAICQAIESLPAGYPGEGHVGWTSICVFSLSSGESTVLERAPYIREVLNTLRLRLRLARLLALEPGGVIREHSDSFLSKRIVRLHLPVVTHPDVRMQVGGDACPWRAGELWYGDFSKPHHGVNGSVLTRVHLVMDVTADEHLLSLFPPDRIPASLSALDDEDLDHELDPRVLNRFAFRFTLPAGFELPGTGLERLPAAAEGSLGLVDSELCVFVNEQPLLKAVPVSEETLDLLGLGAEAQLRYAFDGERIRSVSLALGPHVVYTFDLRAPRLDAVEA
ncbi:aspartyl/asparaginyl beta-hydroxylase domain-containing protein [Lysobacter sp. CA199]|uniref:aspartyl/asparaginyl beta-hydroxylase domain-containing protein n=1 Tax=Lysobacter sp. CA199 TaxID=3455608 RepID=UPI003F8D577E